MVAFARELDIAPSPDVHAPRRVRALLEAEFADLGDALYTAEAIPSAPVTNVILYGERPLRFEARGSEAGVRLAVYDQRGDVVGRHPCRWAGRSSARCRRTRA